MHIEGVIHSDIKADNVLISNTGLPLICDFGISRMLAASQSMDTTTSGQLRGSSRWMAIELFDVGDSSPIHTFQSDVWAFGMTVHVRMSRFAVLILSNSLKRNCSQRNCPMRRLGVISRWRLPLCVVLYLIGRRHSISGQSAIRTFGICAVPVGIGIPLNGSKCTSYFLI